MAGFSRVNGDNKPIANYDVPSYSNTTVVTSTHKKGERNGLKRSQNMLEMHKKGWVHKTKTWNLGIDTQGQNEQVSRKRTVWAEKVEKLRKIHGMNEKYMRFTCRKNTTEKAGFGK